MSKQIEKRTTVKCPDCGPKSAALVDPGSRFLRCPACHHNIKLRERDGRECEPVMLRDAAPASARDAGIDMLVGVKRVGGGLQVVECDPATFAITKAHPIETTEEALGRVDTLLLGRYVA